MIMSMIVDIMEEVERTYTIHTDIAFSKKQTALLLIKKKIGFEEFEIYNDIISELIDFICDISKKKIKLGINKKCKTCLLL